MNQTKNQPKIELTDDQKPEYLYSLTHTDLLVRIANGEVDAVQLAKKELSNRGLNNDGKWIGITNK